MDKFKFDVDTQGHIFMEFEKGMKPFEHFNIDDTDLVFMEKYFGVKNEYFNKLLFKYLNKTIKHNNGRPDITIIAPKIQKNDHNFVTVNGKFNRAECVISNGKHSYLEIVTYKNVSIIKSESATINLITSSVKNNNIFFEKLNEKMGGGNMYNYPGTYSDLNDMSKHIIDLMENIKVNPPTLKGEETYDLTTGEKEIILENGQLLKNYMESEFFGCDLFLKYCEDPLGLVDKYSESYKILSRDNIINELVHETEEPQSD